MDNNVIHKQNQHLTNILSIHYVVQLESEEQVHVTSIAVMEVTSESFEPLNNRSSCQTSNCPKLCDI